MLLIPRTFVTILSFIVFTSVAHAQLIGPSGGVGANGEYTGLSDSPFAEVDFSAGYFHLENFEDGLTTPGVTADHGDIASVSFGPSNHDSVDSDDGTVDGSGLNGESWFYDSGFAGVTWTFSDTALVALPTHVGIVWTDGSGTITFEAFDADGSSLGTVTGDHSCCGNTGETADDRFYGVIDAGGISAIKISNSSGGIEIDHLQYGREQISNVAIEDPNSLLPRTPLLLGNFPNPFSDETTIVLTLADPTPIRVEVFNVVGQLVDVVYDGLAPIGETLLRVDLAKQPTGTYIFRLVANGKVYSRSMVRVE